MLALAATLGWTLEQADADNAYVQADLQETLFADQPEGYDDGTGLKLRLLKALYGLKQSGLAWYNHCHDALISLGFNTSTHDPCMYIKTTTDGPIVVCTYVDDFLIATPTARLMSATLDDIEATMKLKRQGKVHYLLGVKIDYDQEAGHVRLSQEAYTTKMLERFGMLAAHGKMTPETTGGDDQWYDEEQPKADEGLYRAMVGSLVYLATWTRPDIAHAVQRLSSHLNDPRDPHMTAAKRTLRYLLQTKATGIEYFGSYGTDLSGMCDASWATKPDRKSTTGYLWYLAGGPISWRSARQRIVALSSCEAEYVAMSDAVKEMFWIRFILVALGLVPPTTPLMCDNQSAIAMSASTAITDRSKHIDTRYHHVRDLVKEGVVEINYLPTDVMLADTLTKPATGHSIQLGAPDGSDGVDTKSDTYSLP